MSKIISVHSYRGGTGKSNSVSNIAATVARHGNRVGIVDTDIQSPGVHVLFGFDADGIGRSLNDYLWGRSKIEEAAYDVTSVLKNKGNSHSKIYLVPSSVKPGDIARVLREGYDVNLLNDGFQRLIEALDLDYLFIDTHPGLNEETLLSITISDILILILRPDQQDYQGTAVTVDVARRLQVPKLFLVVNKVPAVFAPEQLKSRIEAAYQAEVIGVLPHSDDLMVLASSGIFSLKHPEHQVTQLVEAISKKVMS